VFNFGNTWAPVNRALLIVNLTAPAFSKWNVPKEREMKKCRGEGLKVMAKELKEHLCKHP